MQHKTVNKKNDRDAFDLQNIKKDWGSLFIP